MLLITSSATLNVRQESGQSDPSTFNWSATGAHLIALKSQISRERIVLFISRVVTDYSIFGTRPDVMCICTPVNLVSAKTSSPHLLSARIVRPIALAHIFCSHHQDRRSALFARHVRMLLSG